MQFSKKYALAAAVIVVAGAASYQFLQKPDDDRPGQAVPIQGRDHNPENAPTPEYNSNPPTSGPHASPAPGGFYSVELKDMNVVHTLDHGFVWIAYKDVDDETLANLERLGQQYPDTIIVSPREANDAPIALASWGRIAKMDVYDEAFIIDFIWKNRNNSPEPFAK